MGIEHPSDELLESYCHGDLNHLAQIEAHILHCRECARKVQHIIRLELTKQRMSPPMPIL